MILMILWSNFNIMRTRSILLCQLIIQMSITMKTPTQPSFHSGLCGKSWTDWSKNISLGALRSSTFCISRLKMKIHLETNWRPPTNMQGVNWRIENSPQSGCEHAPDFLQAPSCFPFGTAACTLLKKQPYFSSHTKWNITHSLYIKLSMW